MLLLRTPRSVDEARALLLIWEATSDERIERFVRLLYRAARAGNLDAQHAIRCLRTARRELDAGGPSALN